jgi:hypothetical protein
LVLICVFITPCFGDHVLVIAELNQCKKKWISYYNHDWSRYTPSLLNETLQNCNLNIENVSVQEYWNVFKNILINVIDDFGSPENI